jgi:hypothetical protein
MGAESGFYSDLSGSVQLPHRLGGLEVWQYSPPPVAGRIVPLAGLEELPNPLKLGKPLTIGVPRIGEEGREFLFTGPFEVSFAGMRYRVRQSRSFPLWLTWAFGGEQPASGLQGLVPDRFYELAPSGQLAYRILRDGNVVVTLIVRPLPPNGKGKESEALEVVQTKKEEPGARVVRANVFLLRGTILPKLAELRKGLERPGTRGWVRERVVGQYIVNLDGEGTIVGEPIQRVPGAPLPEPTTQIQVVLGPRLDGRLVFVPRHGEQVPNAFRQSVEAYNRSLSRGPRRPAAGLEEEGQIAIWVEEVLGIQGPLPEALRSSLAAGKEVILPMGGEVRVPTLARVTRISANSPRSRNIKKERMIVVEEGFLPADVVEKLKKYGSVQEIGPGQVSEAVAQVREMQESDVHIPKDLFVVRADSDLERALNQELNQQKKSWNLAMAVVAVPAGFISRISARDLVLYLLDILVQADRIPQRRMERLESIRDTGAEFQLLSTRA